MGKLSILISLFELCGATGFTGWLWTRDSDLSLRNHRTQEPNGRCLRGLDVRPPLTQIASVFIAPFLERRADEHSRLQEEKPCPEDHV